MVKNGIEDGDVSLSVCVWSCHHVEHNENSVCA